MSSPRRARTQSARTQTVTFRTRTQDSNSDSHLSKNLVLGGKTRALLHGNYAVQAADIRAVAVPVLRHRIFTNFNADAEGVDAGAIVRQLLGTLPEPGYGEPSPARGKKSADKPGVPRPAPDTKQHAAPPPAPPAAASPPSSPTEFPVLGRDNPRDNPDQTAFWPPGPPQDE